ncbi:hypothetical protein [Alcanivorax sp.]|uniref:hypothetical protein n=1 Tax=Alcanivorax sp. TaxID=1872427 RepID=UPI0025BE4A5D|nr:hypothetical protein [Alcanivorax sp.]
MQQAHLPEQQLATMQHAIQEVTERVIEGTASPYALIRRSDLQILRRLLQQEAK